MTRRMFGAGAAAVGLMVLSGCANSLANTQVSPEPSRSTTAVGHAVPRGMPAGKGSDVADGIFPRTVVHFAGQTTLEAAPSRVVVISTGQADAMLAMGIVPVGSTAGEGADTVPQYLYRAFPERTAALDSIANVGSRTEPNLEEIANLSPDLIVLNAAGQDDLSSFYASASRIAPTVVSQGTGVYWKQDLVLLADAVGKREWAEGWMSSYHADAARLGDRVSDEVTVSFLRKNADRTRVFGEASFSGSVADDAGLARPQQQRFRDETSIDLSAEQLAKADGDWIFFGVQGGQSSEFTSLALWPTLSAVAAKQAIQVDDDVFYLNVGPIAARGILQTLTDALV